MQTILVIGGCGFIGSHIVDLLRLQGFTVRVLSRRPEVFRAPIPGVEYVLGSMADDGLLEVALAGVDVVIHAASTMVPQTSNLNPIADINENLVASVRLLQKMQAAKVSKIVFLSSGGTVYGTPNQIPLDENHPLLPMSSYGIVKVAIEKYINMFSSLNGMVACILRPSNPYGPRQGRAKLQGIIGVYLSKIVRNEPLEIWGDGTVIRDFIYVEDLAELCVLAARSPVGGVFNAGSGLGVSISKVAHLIARISGSDPELIYKQARNFDVTTNILDISKVQHELGWTPKTSLEAGIQATWQWIKTKQKSEG